MSTLQIDRLPFANGGDNPFFLTPLQILGKAFVQRQHKLYVNGVTYGPFGPCESPSEYKNTDSVKRDFEVMASFGFNAIRTYTVPPSWLLDLAQEQGLRVMIGLPWEQHVTFLDDRNMSRGIVARVANAVSACQQHPAILGYAIGNEIPSPIVRWHGAARIQHFLRALYEEAKDRDPRALFTYVNYPSTEYLELPFLDFLSFNVYLESSEKLAAYLPRLHNQAGDRPLVVAEIGLDSRRNGELRQADLLAEQVKIAHDAGSAGTFVFAWTDEWYRGGAPVEDWDFGLTRRDGWHKQALASVANAVRAEAHLQSPPVPKISVVVCTYNGARYLSKCLSALEEIDYPDYEVIVVDDGSTDSTADIVRRYDVRLIRTENCGLSSARTTGLHAARGHIVAYIDDDAYPDSDWLKHLKMTFDAGYAGVGGPNIPPPEDSDFSKCVAHAPGGPIHVLLSDTDAEHLPGCNMAFRRDALLAIGGFDPQFRAAGDDVDVCWRVQENGGKLGFDAAAIVFHHRRGTFSAYWKQQKGYGKAEALLERKWPYKYNAVGHHTWAGRVYNSRGITPIWWGRSRIYQGTWGTAGYQKLYHPTATLLREFPLLPESYLGILFLTGLSLLGLIWQPLLWALPVLAILMGAVLFQAFAGAARASSTERRFSLQHPIRYFANSFLLHLLHPLARLTGRLQYGLHPWRIRCAWPMRIVRSQVVSSWATEWKAPEDRLRSLQSALHAARLTVVPGGDFDNWDLEVQCGVFAAVRTRLVVEEHGMGRQMARLKLWPRYSWSGVLVSAGLTALAVAAGLDHATGPAIVLGLISAVATFRVLSECSSAMSSVLQSFADLDREPSGTPGDGIAAKAGAR